MGLGRRLLICGFIGTLSLGARAADEPLPIKVRRPVRAGDAFNVHLIFEQSRRETPLPSPTTAPSAATLAASAPAVPEQVLKADLTCRVNILDVDIRGHTSAWITVSKFVSLVDNSEMFPAGKVVGVLNDDLDMYLAPRDGGPLSDDARAVLLHVHPLEYQLDETSFGSKSARRAGETWSVDSVSVGQIDSNALFQVDPDSVRGKVTLVGAEKAGDAPGLRLDVEMTRCGRDRLAKNVGDTIERQDLNMHVSMLYPLEAALPPAESRIITDATTTVARRADSGGQPRETRMEVRTHTVARQTITPVPK